MVSHQIELKSMCSYVSSSLTNGIVSCPTCAFIVCSVFTEWRHHYLAVLSIRWTQEGKMKIKCWLQEGAILPLRVKVIFRYIGLFKFAWNASCTNEAYINVSINSIHCLSLCKQFIYHCSNNKYSYISCKYDYTHCLSYIQGTFLWPWWTNNDALITYGNVAFILL